MKLFKKVENLVSKVVTEQVEGAKVWMVSWDARYGEYSSNFTRKAKAFFSSTDAEKFAESLRQAQKLLCYTENIRIKVEEQE